MSCRLAPDAPSVACIAGTATLTILVSMIAMAWPVSTMASTTPGRIARSARPARPTSPPEVADRVPSVRLVMSLSMTLELCWYLEPGYPGTDATWQAGDQHGRMADVSTSTINGSSEAATGTGNVARRTELAAFLRSRRERISPEDVGLPPGARRRTAGLRREELAQLAGVGVTWYTWLEQGRPINASVQVLDAIARTLRLDAVERGHLFRLAEVPGATGTSPADCPECPLPPQVQAILDAIPLPASVLTERFDLIAWNQIYAALFPRLVLQPAAERNTLLSCLAGPACCSPMPQLNRYSATLVGQ